MIQLRRITALWGTGLHCCHAKDINNSPLKSNNYHHLFWSMRLNDCKFGKGKSFRSSPRYKKGFSRAHQNAIQPPNLWFHPLELPLVRRGPERWASQRATFPWSFHHFDIVCLASIYNIPIHTYIPYHTIPYHYITLHYITLRYIYYIHTLHILHTLHTYITYITYIHYIYYIHTLHTLHTYITYITYLHTYITLHYIRLHYITYIPYIIIDLSCPIFTHINNYDYTYFWDGWLFRGVVKFGPDPFRRWMIWIHIINLKKQYL